MSATNENSLPYETSPKDDIRKYVVVLHDEVDKSDHLRWLYELISASHRDDISESKIISKVNETPYWDCSNLRGYIAELDEEMKKVVQKNKSLFG